MQLNEGNRETRAATVQVALKAEMDMMHVMAEHAGTWEKVMAGEPLASGEEMRRGIVIYNLLMTDTEHSYQLFESGYLEEGAWQGRLDSVPILVSLPIFETWKKTAGGISHSPDFLALLDNVKEEISGN
jgi:hypothetical protein